eukprot:756237-Hanusia_phi.AAC.2
MLPLFLTHLLSPHDYVALIADTWHHNPQRRPRMKEVRTLWQCDESCFPCRCRRDSTGWRRLRAAEWQLHEQRGREVVEWTLTDKEMNKCLPHSECQLRQQT